MGTRKKAIHIVMITEDSIYPTREISVGESPVHLVSYLLTRSFQVQSVYHDIASTTSLFINIGFVLL